MAASITVIILTRNEGSHIARAIESCRGFAGHIFVVDSFSTDNTVEIASAEGAAVVQNPFKNQAQQFQWALDNLPIVTDWVMRLDADEVVEGDLSSEILRKVPSISQDVTGIMLKRKHYFLGRWVRYGGRYPIVLLRIWRVGAARIEQRWMDEHVILNYGRAIKFNGNFSDINLGNLSYFISKHNEYATREAVDVVNRRRELFPREQELKSSQVPMKVLFTRILKEKIYNKVPFQVSASSYFVLRYIFQLGFLDGVEGSIYHVLQGFWYRYLVGAKTLELERELGSMTGVDAVRRIEEVTGLRLS